MQKIINLLQSYTKNVAGRLFHGRGKNFPEFDYFNIDFFPPYIIIYLYKEPNQDFLISNLVEGLKSNSNIDIKGIICQRRYLKDSPIELLYGNYEEEFISEIEGEKYAFKLGKSQNLGFFIDMELLRNWLRLNSKNKKILNLFSYTCALSVVALKSEAQMVLNFDMSKGAMKRGLLNHRINNLNLNKVKFFEHDVFKSFGKMSKESPYDIIIIDPPSDHGKHFNIERDYEKLILRTYQYLKEEGFLILALNSPHHSFEFLVNLTKKIDGPLFLSEKFGLPDHFMETNKDAGLKVAIFKKEKVHESK
jgi:23S rRNA (cytosine1962-C5)-methyltransferase